VTEEDRYSGRCRQDAVAGPSGAGISSKNAGDTSISLQSPDEHDSDSPDSQDVAEETSDVRENG
jgi:hypothetical protein